MASDELKTMINKVIEDQVVTPKEFEKVMQIAEADGRIDSEERALLKELHNMLIDKTIRRGPDA